MGVKIWAVPQLRDGSLPAAANETVAAAQGLAKLLGGDAEAVVLGSEVEAASREVAATALAAVRVADHEAFARYTPGVWSGALAAAIRAAGPSVVLFPHTYQTVDFLPRLAQELAAALVPEAVTYRVEGEAVVWTRPVLGGKLMSEVRAKGDGPVLVSVQAGAFPADGVEPGQAPIEALAVDAESLAPWREILGIERAAEEEVDLSAADVIVAVGRGVGGPDKMAGVEELAKELGAEIGASRPVIDGGWLPRDRQIGSSGQTVSPKLYLALGISGAIQHLVGMKGSKVVVAINKDRSAPIFSVARYGVVADLHEVLPALIEAVRDARG